MKIKKAKRTAHFSDSFHTALENLGARRRDVTSRYNGHFFREPRLDYDELNSIYQSVPIVRRAIELITGHLLKNGVSFTIPDNPEATAEVTALAERVDINRLFEEAALLTLINGCGGVLLVEKDMNPHKELNLRRLKGRTPKFSIIDGKFITTTPELDPLSPDFYTPQMYQVVGMSVHPTWFNAFSGLPVSQTLKPQYKYMGMSLIENAYTSIVNDELMNKAIPNIVYRSSVVNYKITGMKEALKTGDEGTLLKYVSDTENMKSILNATICDGDDAVEVISRELSGLEGLDQRSAYRLSAAFGIAATVLWGKSPDGMNATGHADWENFYNFVEVWQKRWFNNLRWFYKILIACVTGRDDVDFELEFNKASLVSPQQKVANDAVILQNVAMMRDQGLPDSTIQRYLVENEILTEEEAADYAQTLEEMDAMESLGVGADESDEDVAPIVKAKEPKPKSLERGVKPVKEM